MKHYFSYPMSNHVADDLVAATSSTTQENQFSNISDEILPLVKELIGHCAAKGLFIKILSRNTVVRRSLINDLDFDFTAAFEATESPADLAYHNFGLAFGVGIYESSACGQLRYLDHQVFYDKVGRIGESIGLTWAGNHPILSSLRYFELRPTWAAAMSEKEMISELYRRKNAQISLIAS
ncbi:MAG: hypothetical protein ACO1N4_10675 [Pedobacter sp.]|jgi:hypothetical protein